jgi:hypothetical protein
MQISKYLVVRKINNWNAAARITHKKPSLRSDEIAIALTVSIPDALFQRPALKAEIKIDEKVIPHQISAEVIDNLQQIISDNLNLTVEISRLSQ